MLCHNLQIANLSISSSSWSGLQHEGINILLVKINDVFQRYMFITTGSLVWHNIICLQYISYLFLILLKNTKFISFTLLIYFGSWFYQVNGSNIKEIRIWKFDSLYIIFLENSCRTRSKYTIFCLFVSLCVFLFFFPFELFVINF